VGVSCVARRKSAVLVEVVHVLHVQEESGNVDRGERFPAGGWSTSVCCEAKDGRRWVQLL
jgi:hypothetical protein